MNRKAILKKINSLTAKAGLDFYYWLYSMQTKKNLEEKYNHYKSLKTDSYSPFDDNQKPWFTYPAIHFLDKINLSYQTILEYGGGSSSKYFSRLCKQMTTIENNEEWYQHLKNLSIKNQTIIFQPDLSKYPYATQENEFDLVIVDGRERVNCVKHIMTFPLKPKTVILDNSERYPEATDVLTDNSYIEIPFEGLAAGSPVVTCTSFYFQQDHIVELLRHR